MNEGRLLYFGDVECDPEPCGFGALEVGLEKVHITGLQRGLEVSLGHWISDKHDTDGLNIPGDRRRDRHRRRAARFFAGLWRCPRIRWPPLGTCGDRETR